MIEIKNLQKYFNKGKKNEIHVINDTSLTLPDAGLVALLGESGCGKTTMLNAIGGLDTVKSGSIVINGKKITSHNVASIDKIRNLSVGYIFQDYKLIDDMSVFDNVALALKMVGIKDKAEQKKRVEYVLEKTGILRYRYRPASTLSGGERQRVGIARALVKNPDIILADEPTGNLDSKNSVEIMNIIKTISRDRLVILVTHERKLADFYASRVIELVDGKVVKDYENDHDNDLDYEVDNVFYLKEFEKHESFSENGTEVDVYGAPDDHVKVNIIFKNGNIYIQSKDPNINVEAIEQNSGLEVVDDYKQALDKEALENYSFNMSEVENDKFVKRHSSILNPFNALIAGFKKVFSFSILKKLLLVGFMITGIFIVYAVGRIGTIMHVEDKDFVKYNKNYVSVEKPNLSIEEFEAFEKLPGVKYVLPTLAVENLVFNLGDYYQTQRAEVSCMASLSSRELISESDLIMGEMPTAENEIVFDKLAFDRLLHDLDHNASMAGVTKASQLFGRECELKNGSRYKIVGVVDMGSPSVYVSENEMFKMLYYNNSPDDYYDYGWQTVDRVEETDQTTLTDFNLIKDRVTLKSGNWPENDYEIVVNYNLKDQYKLGKEIKAKLNDHQLKVVGYYTSDDVQLYLCTPHTIKIKQIANAKNFMICTDDKASLVDTLKQQGYSANDTYEKSRDDYDKERQDTVTTTCVLSGIILGISLIEMFLISRSSFLSRIKEIGTLRAIGAKKTDIYKMFIGEIVAITTLTSTPAIIFTYIVCSKLAGSISYFATVMNMQPLMLVISLVIAYAFNLIIGLIPVFNTMRKRPAAILARYDVD